MKGRSIQDNLHLIREVLEGIKDDTEAVLISLDQSKAFDRVDHRFLATVLETAGFKPEFLRWISMMYHNPQAVVQVNGRRSGAIAIDRSVRQGCPLSPLLYVLALEPLLRRLGDEGTSPTLHGIPFVGRLAARVSAFADDITVFVSRRLDIEAEHAFYYCERVNPFWDHVGEWTARIEPKQLVLLDVGYVVDNVLPPFHGEKRMVFLAILAVTRMVIWMTRNKGLYDDANCSHRDLVLYFRHQLRVKIRCNRKRFDRITFSKRWVNAASLVVRKGAMLESSFPPMPAHGVYGTGPLGPHPW